MHMQLCISTRLDPQETRKPALVCLTHVRRCGRSQLTGVGKVCAALQVVMAGALTDQCVESAVRDACDLQYLVTLVTGARGCRCLACCRASAAL